MVGDALESALQLKSMFVIGLLIGLACGPGGAGTSADSGELCGNGVLDPGEQCDDANDYMSDGCNNDCVQSGTIMWIYEGERGEIGQRLAWDGEGVVLLGTVGVVPRLSRFNAAGERLWAVNPNDGGAEDLDITLDVEVIGDRIYVATEVNDSTDVAVRAFDLADGSTSGEFRVAFDEAGLLTSPELAVVGDDLLVLADAAALSGVQAEFARVTTNGTELWRASDTKGPLLTRPASHGESAYVGIEGEISELTPAGLTPVMQRANWRPRTLFVDEFGFHTTGADPSVASHDSLLWSVSRSGESSLEAPWGVLTDEAELPIAFQPLPSYGYAIAASIADDAGAKVYHYVERVSAEGSPLEQYLDESTPSALDMVVGDGDYIYVAGTEGNVLGRYAP